jgi:hypothetical protein
VKERTQSHESSYFIRGHISGLSRLLGALYPDNLKASGTSHPQRFMCAYARATLLEFDHLGCREELHR